MGDEPLLQREEVSSVMEGGPVAPAAWAKLPEARKAAAPAPAVSRN